MTRGHLGKIFGAVGLVLLIICLNTWLASQGGKAVLSISLIHDERPAMAFFGLIICSLLLIFVCAIGLIYSSRFGSRWHDRVPTIWLSGLDTATWEGKIFQATILLLVIVLPTLALWHFADIVATSTLCELGTNRAQSVSSAWWTGIADAKEQIRLVSSLTTMQQADGHAVQVCANGIEVFPGWEFALVGFLVVGAAISGVAFVGSLFRP